MDRFPWHMLHHVLRCFPLLLIKPPRGGYGCPFVQMGIVSLSELVKVPPLDRWQGCGSRHSIKHTRLQYLLRVRKQAQCLWGHHHLILQDGTVSPLLR